MKRLTLCATLCLLFVPAVAVAHYPFFSIDSKASPKGTLNFYFEEGPRAGDGQYIDPFLKTGVYKLRTGKESTKPLKLKEVKAPGKRWMAVDLDAPAPRAVECYCKWGVYKGRLLHYYAKHIDVAAPKQFAEVGRAPELKFDLVPSMANGMVELKVLFEGKPRAGQSVTVGGPKTRQNIKSDEQGVVRFKPTGAGLYWFRAAFVDPKPSGKDDGKDYKGLRQTATLTMELPVGE